MFYFSPYSVSNLVYLTKNIDSPPPTFKKPPATTALMCITCANVTRKGAAMFPKLDIASVMPSPVDLMLVGNVSAVIRLNKEKATVFESLLSPIKNN